MSLNILFASLSLHDGTELVFTNQLKVMAGSSTSRCSTVHVQAHHDKNRVLLTCLQQREDAAAAWPQKGVQHRERSSWSESMLYLLTLLFDLSSI